MLAICSCSEVTCLRAATARSVAADNSSSWASVVLANLREKSSNEHDSSNNRHSTTRLNCFHFVNRFVSHNNISYVICE